MNLHHVVLVFRKELQEVLRDKRTIRSMILGPLIIIPLLINGMVRLTSRFLERAESEAATVMLLGAENAPLVSERIRKTEGIQVVPADPAGYRHQIEEKQLRAAVEFPPGFEALLAAGTASPDLVVEIYHYQNEVRSESAVDKVQKVLREYRDEVIQARLASRDLSADVLRPFKTDEKNVASAEKVGGAVLGGIIPYVIILLTLSGAMYPAIDLTAGEKERGTMETILASPVSRGALTAGKFLTVLTISATTALLSLVSMAFTSRYAGFSHMGGAHSDRAFQLVITWKGIVAVLGMIVPVAVMFSAALLAVALMAKSFKEAQSYLSPLMIVVILPAFSAMIPGLELNPRLALVPILNVSLVSKEILSGTYHWNLIALILLSSSVYAAIALVIAARQFQRESVLFRT
jgi:sodium transport system permease protein